MTHHQQMRRVWAKAAGRPAAAPHEPEAAAPPQARPRDEVMTCIRRCTPLQPLRYTLPLSQTFTRLNPLMHDTLVL